MCLVYGIDYKYSCVADADGNYIIIALVMHEPIYMPPPLREDEAPDYSKMETKMGWVVRGYAMQEGERLIDAVPPIRRPYAGADGLVQPRWDFDTKAWYEDATAEEITAWEADHPAPEPVPDVPSETEQLKAQVAALEAEKAERAELEAIASAIERGLSV